MPFCPCWICCLGTGLFILLFARARLPRLPQRASEIGSVGAERPNLTASLSPPALSWSKRSRSVTALTNGQALEHQVQVFFQTPRPESGDARGLACARHQQNWSSEDAACTSAWDLEQKPSQCAPSADAASFQLELLAGPILEWSSAISGQLLVTAGCWPNSGACARFSKAFLDVAGDFTNLTGVFSGRDREVGIAFVAKQHVQASLLCGVIDLSARDGRWCGGCVPYTDSEPWSGAAACTLAADRIQMQVRPEGIHQLSVSWKATRSVPAESLVVAPQELALAPLPAAWMCSGTGHLDWDVRRAQTQSDKLLVLARDPVLLDTVDAHRCARADTWSRAMRLAAPPLQLSEQNVAVCGANESWLLVENSADGSVARVADQLPHELPPTQTAHELDTVAPGLWEFAEAAVHILLNPRDSNLWVLPADGPPQLCVTAADRREAIELQNGPWAPPSPQTPACRGAGAHVAVEVLNRHAHFFYVPAGCSLRAGGVWPCDCYWSWARPNVTVLADGAALAAGCGVVQAKATPISHWELEKQAAACIGFAANTSISRGLPPECVGKQACATPDLPSPLCQIKAVLLQTRSRRRRFVARAWERAFP